MKPLVAIAVLATTLVGLTLDRPGLTIDEGFNTRQGVVMLRLQAQSGLAALSPPQQVDLFDALEHDYPPLGRAMLGLGHELTAGEGLVGSPGKIDVAAARWTSAVCFGLTIVLVGAFARKWHGDVAGISAALAMLTTPRLFGHAHLASIETVLNLVFAACVLVSANRLADAPTKRDAAICGALWGLVLLTKVQAVLIPLPLAAWMVWIHRNRAWGPLAIFAAAGLTVFVAGWPWLWPSPIDRTIGYFAGESRVALHLWYGGRSWIDADVPWHAPIVLFALTQPLPWLAAGGYGLARTRDRRTQLVAACSLFPLAFFAIPGVPLYDGVRLFLVAYPLWAVLVGTGAASLWTLLPRRRVPIAAVAVAVPALQLLSTAPAWLSDSSLGPLVGDRLLERNYWGDAVTDDLWPDGRSPVAVAPVLAPWQTAELSFQQRRPVVAWPEPADDLIVFARLADLQPDSVPWRLVHGESVDGWEVRGAIRVNNRILAVHATRRRRAERNAVDGGQSFREE